MTNKLLDALTTVLLVKIVNGPGFVPDTTSWVTDAMPSPRAVISGTVEVARKMLFPLLLKLAVALAGAVRPFASTRVPISLKEPDWVFPVMSAAPINEIVMVLPDAVTIEAAAKTPVAAVIRIASPVGTSVATPVPGFATPDVIVLGNVNTKLVVLTFDDATNAPDTTIPASLEDGSEVSAVRLVLISIGDGVLKIVILIWAKLLGARANATITANSPNANLDLILVFSFSKSFNETQK